MDRHIAFALRLDDAPREIEDDDAITEALRADAPAWLHLAADHPDTPEWIDRHLSWLDPAVRAALTEPETRPRALRIDGGLMVILRGINFNEGDPEDMVSLRMYLDPARVVSLSRRPLRSVNGLAGEVRAGGGPSDAGTLLTELVERLTDLIEAQVADLDDRAERLEVAVIEDARSELGSEVSDQRLELVELRRFLPPQRDAVQAILRTDLAWLEEGHRRRLDEQLDQLTRVVETLEAVREQLSTIASEIDAARDERLNRNLYVLSVISAVFLPLGFLTGLMGINLAGMPGSNWPPAFWVFCAGLVGVTGLVLAILKWMRVL